MAVIGSLSVKLGLVTVDWDKATTKAKLQARQLQTSLNGLTNNFKSLGKVWNSVGGALGVGIGSFGALAASALSFSNQVNDMSVGFGLSIPRILQFRDAVQTSGGNAEKAGAMIGKMYQALEEASRGTELSIARFEQIGISFKELETLTPEKALQRVAEQISKIENAAKRAYYTKEFFGKGGVGVDLTSVSEKLKGNTKAYDENAAAVKKLGIFSDNLKTTMDNLKLAMAGIMAPFTGDGLIGIKTFTFLLTTIIAATTISQVIKFVAQLWELAKAVIAIRNATLSLDAAKIAKNPALAILLGLGTAAALNKFAGGPSDTDTSNKGVWKPITGPDGKPIVPKEAKPEQAREIRRDELAGVRAQILSLIHI